MDRNPREKAALRIIYTYKIVPVPSIRGQQIQAKQPTKMGLLLLYPCFWLPHRVTQIPSTVPNHSDGRYVPRGPAEKPEIVVPVFNSTYWERAKGMSVNGNSHCQQQKSFCFLCVTNILTQIYRLQSAWKATDPSYALNFSIQWLRNAFSFFIAIRGAFWLQCSRSFSFLMVHFVFVITLEKSTL